MNKLENIEKQLREALSADRLEETDLLVQTYRQTFDETWDGMSEAERANSTLPRSAATLMRWAISMTAAVRSATQAQRKVIRALKPYNQNGQRTATIWQAQG